MEVLYTLVVRRKDVVREITVHDLLERAAWSRVYAGSTEVCHLRWPTLNAPMVALTATGIRCGEKTSRCLEFIIFWRSWDAKCEWYVELNETAQNGPIGLIWLMRTAWRACDVYIVSFTYGGMKTCECLEYIASWNRKRKKKKKEKGIQYTAKLSATFWNDFHIGTFSPKAQ